MLEIFSHTIIKNRRDKFSSRPHHHLSFTRKTRKTLVMSFPKVKENSSHLSPKDSFSALLNRHLPLGKCKQNKKESILQTSCITPPLSPKPYPEASPHWPASSDQFYELGLVPASRSEGSSQSQRWRLCPLKPNWFPGHQPLSRAGNRSPVHNAIYYFMQWPSQKQSHSPISPDTWKPLQGVKKSEMWWTNFMEAKRMSGTWWESEFSFD